MLPRDTRHKYGQELKFEVKKVICRLKEEKNKDKASLNLSKIYSFHFKRINM